MMQGALARNAPFGRKREMGHEHLSSVREEYLLGQSLDTGLRYHHLTDVESFSAALNGEAFSEPQTVGADIRWAPAGCALALLLFTYSVVPWVRRWQ